MITNQLSVNTWSWRATQLISLPTRNHKKRVFGSQSVSPPKRSLSLTCSVSIYIREKLNVNSHGFRSSSTDILLSIHGQRPPNANDRHGHSLCLAWSQSHLNSSPLQRPQLPKRRRLGLTLWSPDHDPHTPITRWSSTTRPGNVRRTLHLDVSSPRSSEAPPGSKPARLRCRRPVSSLGT